MKIDSVVISLSFNIGNNIKNLRIENNMTTNDLATLLSCSLNDVKNWEEGLSFPDIMMLPKIANIFNVSVEYLTSGEIDTHKNYDQILDKVSKTDDISLLDDNVIKGIDKKNKCLIDYVIKCESVKVFDYLIKNNKIKYALNNIDIKNYQDEIVYLATITNNLQALPNIGLKDISIIEKWPTKALNAIINDNRVNSEELEYILKMHKRNIEVGEYKFMPNDNRHVKGYWQITYISLLELAIKEGNINFLYKLYKAILDANSYAISIVKKNNIDYKLYSTPLDKYESQNSNNIPICLIPYELLNELLKKKMFTILRYFNDINRQLNIKCLDTKKIDEEELMDDKNATDMDILRIRFVKNGLLNIKEMFKNFTKPSKYEKQIMLNMISNYPICYLELINNLLSNNKIKDLFEFSVDYELNYLTKLIMNKKYDFIIDYSFKAFGYYDVLEDGHIKEIKEKIKNYTLDIKKYEEENNYHLKNRCYEKIAKIIEDEKNSYLINMANNGIVNSRTYQEMLETQFECINFSTFMTINKNNIKQTCENYKIKLYNEYIKKVGANNE